MAGEISEAGDDEDEGEREAIVEYDGGLALLKKRESHVRDAEWSKYVSGYPLTKIGNPTETFLLPPAPADYVSTPEVACLFSISIVPFLRTQYNILIHSITVQ